MPAHGPPGRGPKVRQALDLTGASTDARAGDFVALQQEMRHTFTKSLGTARCSSLFRMTAMYPQ